MKLFLAFSGEGPTDNRFVTVLVERLVTSYLIAKELTAEISWTIIRVSGSSKDCILSLCKQSKNHSLAIFHRDSGNTSWEQAFENHFEEAVGIIQNNQKGIYNKALVPFIPVQEIEAWMLCNKEVLKRNLNTTLSNNELGLNYKVSRIEDITDPKSVIEVAIQTIRNSVPRKKRKYLIKIGELYDVLASEIPIQDLSQLDSFRKLQTTLASHLDQLIEE